MMDRLRGWARSLKRDVMTLWFALRHPDISWGWRVLAAMVTAYALSPLDLIPDFIPILGYLDDLILVPAGVWVMLRLLPQPIRVASRQLAVQWFEARQAKPRSLAGLMIILVLWMLACAWLFDRLFS